MKVFLQGAGFGLLFSAIAVLFLKLSPWAIFPDISAGLFVLGGGLMGGLFHHLLGSMLDVGSDSP